MKKKIVNILNPRTLVHLLIVRPVVRLLFSASAIGTEHFHNLDRFIIIANHNSHLDVFLLFQVLQPSKIISTHVVAALDYFRKPRWLFLLVDFLFKPIWVDRSSKGTSSIEAIQALLDRGESIILFPEGTRGETAELKDFHKGIGVLAKNNPGVPVIPVYLEGPEKAFPKKVALPLPLQNFITISPPQILRGGVNDITGKLHNHLMKIVDEERSLRQRRRGKPEKPYLVAVIGIDGSGKSTLSRKLAEKFSGDSCFIGDSLELFCDGNSCAMQPLITNELRLWIGSKAKKAKKLALYKIPKITELLLRDHLLLEVNRWYRPDCIFMDGSPLLNIVGWSILYHEDAFSEKICIQALEILSGNKTPRTGDPIYKQFPELFVLCKMHLNQLRIPDAVIFLDVDPTICVERIVLRGKDIQPHENIEKLSKLRSAYQLVCKSLQSTGHNVCILEGGKLPPEHITRQAFRYLETLRNDRYGTH